MRDRALAALVAGAGYFDDAAGDFYNDGNAAGIDYSSGAAADDRPWGNGGNAAGIDYSSGDDDGNAAGIDYSSGEFYPDVAGDDDAAGRGRAPVRMRGGFNPAAMARAAIVTPLQREIARLRQELARERSKNGHAMQKWAMNASQGDQPQLDLPFAFATITAGASATITVTSPEPIVIVNLYTDPVQADACLINSISVGRLNLLLNATGVPANSFVPEARRSPMRSPRIPASTPIVLQATNRTLATVSLNGTLRCLTLINA